MSTEDAMAAYSRGMVDGAAIRFTHAVYAYHAAMHTYKVDRNTLKQYQKAREVLIEATADYESAVRGFLEGRLPLPSVLGSPR